MPAGYFVFTSNVDGQFQRAGFAADRIVECHGSIQYLQCATPCNEAIWAVGKTRVSVDDATFLASEPFPRCPVCGGLARPNILMFGDAAWIDRRSSEQEDSFADWLQGLGRAKFGQAKFGRVKSGEVEIGTAKFGGKSGGAKLVVVELGAGTAVPSVRMTSEKAARHLAGKLIRINVREAQVPEGHIGIAGAAKASLEHIRDMMAEQKNVPKLEPKQEQDYDRSSSPAIFDATVGSENRSIGSVANRQSAIRQSTSDPVKNKHW